MHITVSKRTLPLACTRRCGAVRVAMRTIVDLHPLNRPRCHQTHLAVFEPTSLVANPYPRYPTHLAGVQPPWLVSFVGAKPISPSSNPVCRCGIRFIVVESSLLYRNMLCRCRIHFAVVEFPSSCWNPLRRPQIRFVVLKSALLWRSLLWSHQIHFVVTKRIWNSHRPGGTPVIVESASQSWNPLAPRQILLLLVESSSPWWNPLRRCLVCLVVVEFAMVALGTTVSGMERGKKGENEPRQTSWLVFGDALRAPPHSWVPRHVHPSLILIIENSTVEQE
jgi:hypothetical protein